MRVALLTVLLTASGCCLTLDLGGGTKVVSESTPANAPTVRRPRIVQKPATTSPAKPIRPSGKTVTIEAFLDYQCPYCRRVWGSLRRLKAQYKGRVKIVVRHNPLKFHDKARPAAVAALAAERQNKLWEMSDLLFLTPGNLPPERYPILAKQLGLDVARFRRDMGDPALLARIDQDQALARRRGAQATPTLFIGKTRLVGAKSYKRIASIVNGALSPR